ncbi:hypothetical protein KR084_002790 [Drosophila pseudotakahashii]|nr:hypothetical protein KR084_002790 [Drosophila pseudotakahashii]
MKWKCCASAVITLLLLVLLPPPSAAQFNQQFNQRRQVPQNCFTPDSIVGNCVPLSNCPHEAIIFRTISRDRAERYVNALQSSCGPPRINENPLICCTEPVYDQPVTGNPRNLPIYFPTEPPLDFSKNPFLFPITPRTTTTTPAPIPVTTSARFCRGPDSKPGNCIELNQCDSLVKELLVKQHDKIFVNFIRTSRLVCGNQGNQVCCPNGQTVNTPDPNISTKPAGIIPRNTDEVPRRLLNVEDGCGYTNVAKKKIVGGVVSRVGTWPWIALLGYKDPLIPFQCGGSLITARHVITAAHCITSNLTFVRLGEHELTTDKETRHLDLRIARSVIHPGYNPRNGHSDLAILYLDRNVEFTSKISPICLPHTPDLRHKSYLGYNPFVAGWGKTMEQGQAATVLNEVQVPILENRLCHQSFGNLMYHKKIRAEQFDSAVICAGDLTGHKDSCLGDSGGPMMMPEMYEGTFRYHLIGVVAYGIAGCARPGYPAVYTSIQYFMDWISQQVQQTP